MFNDLPENLKKEVRGQYYIRLGIIAGLCFLAVEIIAGFLMFPSWTLSLVKKQEVENSLVEIAETQKSVRVSSDTISISHTNEILKVLNTSHDYPHIIPLYNTILSFKKNGIRFEKISFVSQDSSGANISLEGTAITRDVLVAFSKDLKSSPEFTEVVLPISNLAKDTDVDFRIDIRIAKK